MQLTHSSGRSSGERRSQGALSSVFPLCHLLIARLVHRRLCDGRALLLLPVGDVGGEVG